MEPSSEAPLASSNALWKLAKSRRYDDLEAAWMDALDAPGDPRRFLPALELLVARGETARAESLLWYLLETLRERGTLADALTTAKTCAALLPQSDSLRAHLADLYRAAGAPADAVDAVLGAKADALDRRVALLDRLLSMPVGAFVVDAGAKTAGRVTGLDAAAQALRVATPHGEEKVPFASLDRLEPRPEDDFYVLAAFHPERLRAMAEESPDGLLLALLRSTAPRMEYRDVRRALTPFLPPGGWAPWWRKARAALERSGAILLGDGAQPTLILARRETPYAERVVRRVEAAAPQERPALLLEVLDDLAEHAHPEGADLLRTLCARVDGALPCPSDALAAAAAADEALRRCGEDPPARLPEGMDEDAAAAALPALRPGRVAGSVLDFLRRALPDRWPVLCAGALPACPAALCESIAARLLDAGRGDLLLAAARRVGEDPSCHPGALVWLWKSHGSLGRLAGGPPCDRAALAERLLWAAGRAERACPDKADRRALLGAIRRALVENDLEAVRLACADADAARRALAAVRHCPALTDADRAEALARIKERHPDLFAQTAPPWEQDVLYTTAEGFERRRREYQDIVQNRLLENSRAIAEALKKGDLRENADYSAALEERQRLTEAASRIEAELLKAKVITRDLADAERVTVGSTVRAVEEASGREEVFTFLGPWDAAPEKRIFSYRSPLGLAFMGRGVGQTAALPAGGETRRWRIAEIRWEAG